MSVIVANALGYRTRDGARPLQESLHFVVDPGTLLWVRGPNGCGKSTLLDVLQGRHSHTGDLTVSVNRDRIAVVPQVEAASLHVPMTLGDFVRLSAPQFTGSEPWVKDWFDESFQALKWSTASGGERRRALLVRALATRPKLLFLDEPMNHLDPRSRAIILELLKDFLAHSDGASAVLVSHEDSTRDLQKMGAQFRELVLVSSANTGVGGAR